MKWKTLPCILIMCVTITETMNPQMIFAEETKGYEFLYEFPFTAELYVDTIGGTGKYYEIDLKCRTSISADGYITFWFIGDNDFYYAPNDIGDESSVTIIFPRFVGEANLPDWYDGYNTVEYNYQGHAFGINGELYYYSLTNAKTTSAVQYNSFSSEAGGFKLREHLYRFLNGNEYEVEYMKWDKGQTIGKFAFKPSVTIYEDEEKRHFVKSRNGSEKVYFHDVISITVNNMTISKEIGDNWANTPALVYRQGDVNNDGAIDKSDVVLLQKWLITEAIAIPVWQAADMNNDNQLDARDLSLLKRYINKQE